MRKFILLTILILFLTINLLPSNIAYAMEEEYIKITDDTTSFYINPSFLAEDELFIIPKGYYVLVIKEYEDYYEVSYGENNTSYNSLIGFVKKSNTLLKNIEEDIFPCFLNYLISPTTDTKLYTKADINSKVKYAITTGQTLSYIGSLTQNGRLFYYVQFGNSFGYVDNASFDNISIPEHKIPIAKEEEPNDDETITPPPAKDTSNIAKAIKTGLIIAITIPAVIIVIILFFPSKKTKI